MKGQKMFSKWKVSLGINTNKTILGGLAQIALVGYIALLLLSVPNTEFIQGMLLGFSLVGNIAWLIHLRRE
ncbi:MAG: hypothetical protein P8046_06550 [Anaerolineales bacterium]|jgi:hypothetical protein